MNTYQVGSGAANILLAADINTVGLAATRAIVLVVTGTDAGTPVAHSVDATGDISEQSIGQPAKLKGQRLSIFTKIDLLGTDAPTRQLEAQNIGATYTLSGGDSGNQTYNNPTKTYMDPSVFLNFLVDLQ